MGYTTCLRVYSRAQLCCDEHLTKEFTVVMNRRSQIYVWSFAKQEWLLQAIETLPSQ